MLFLSIFSEKLDNIEENTSDSNILSKTPMPSLLTSSLLNQSLLAQNDSSNCSTENAKETERRPLFDVQNSSAMAKIREVSNNNYFLFFRTVKNF